MELKTGQYINQQNIWPSSGHHILAQYNEDLVVVYQAFKQSIAKYAVENQTFGGDDYIFGRMSWLKTNFLWMMYRSGWASKKNQEHILAIHISRSGFDEILKRAYSVNREKAENLTKHDISVRLQWDPDHAPDGTCVQRRAIQLGLKNETLQQFVNEWIVKIEDITEFVKEQRNNLNDLNKLIVPLEDVFTVTDLNIAQAIEVDCL